MQSTFSEPTLRDATRVCACCKVSKSVTTEFYKRNPGKAGGWDGTYRSWCKDCARARNRKPRTCLSCNVEYFHIGSSGARRRLCDPCGEAGHICARCETYQSRENFRTFVKPNGRTQTFSYCPPCTSEMNLEIRYGVPYSTIAALIESANGVCEICHEPDEDMNVDHCHDSGEIRGYLCGGCNRGLGQLGDSIEKLEGAIRYLREKSPTAI